MGIMDCARAILKYVPDRDTAVTFVAIAGAESGWRLDAAGDGFGGYWSCMTDDCRRRWDKPCQSFGPWQINIPAHYPWLSQMAGTNDPCGIARWLTASYDNNARAAYEVWRRRGANTKAFCAWSVYEKWCSDRHNGSYRNYLSQARQAVDAVLGEQPPPVIPPVPVPSPAFLAVAAVAAVALGGAGAGLVIFANRERIKQWWYNRTGTVS